MDNINPNDPHEYKTIEGVQVDITVLQNTKGLTKEQVAGHFEHLPTAKAEAATATLWALIKGKDVPNKYADTVDLSEPGEAQV